MTEVARLQRFFKPARYELNLIPNKTKLTFTGSVKIAGQLVGRQNILRLHAKDLKISSVKINDQICRFKILKRVVELQINLPGGLNTNKLIVQILFSGNITTQMHGLYPCKSAKNETFIASHLESHHAREVFPCIDEPLAKAVFSLNLTVPKGDQVLSNTLPAKKTMHAKTYTVRFQDTPLMPTYLLALAIGNWRCKKIKTKDGVQVRAWAAPELLKQVNFSLDVAKKTLEFFNDYLKYPYPLPKLDLLALPDFESGIAAMENWGLITFNESCMLVDEQNSSLDTKKAVATVTAHEIAHMWFGNLVTMQWWNDLWLNEGFASWLEYLAIDKLFPKWNSWTHFLVSEQLPAFRLDSLKNTHAIEVKIAHPDEIPTIFDNISYAKGASIVHMLHKYLGDKSFKKGVTSYLHQYAYSNTTTDDLWQALQAASGLPVKEFMSAWTSQPGFPLVEVKPAGKQLTISQSRFSNDIKNTRQQPLWPVPLLAPGLPIKLLNQPKITVKAPLRLSKFKLNLGQSGFYITKYWPKQYDRLAKLITKSQLNEADRLCLLTDMLTLTKTGRLPLKRLVQILPSFKKETSEPVWDAVALTISDIRRVMGPATRSAIKPLINELTKYQVERLGWQAKPKDSHDDKLLRPLVLALADIADNQAVISEAYVRFIKANVIEDLDKDLRGVILSSVSKRGGKAEFNKMLKMYKLTNSAEDKTTLSGALTNFRHPAEYKRALDLIQSKDVRLQEAVFWVIYSLANPAARDYAWNWLRKNWSWLKENFGQGSAFPRLPVFVATYYNNRQFLNDYKTFFNKVAEPSLKRSTRQGVELIKLQSDWYKRDHESLLKWLKTF